MLSEPEQQDQCALAPRLESGNGRDGEDECRAEKSLPRMLSQKYLGEDPPAEPDEVLRVIVQMTPQKVTGFSG
ncbi:hypothetical protein [Streptomyces sp. NPDC056401]|uniref:hypothetical protein n=1 Tax=Streptomyces sp. NPDC056401 TaxID=3345809 RepID=UPI0035D81AE0